MKFLFRHLLLIGVILGLAGQGAAFAAQPCAAMQAQQETAMAAPMAAPMAAMADCAMEQETPDKAPPPCKDMTPACRAMAGCASLAAFEVPSIAAPAPTRQAGVALWPAPPVLIGRSIAPDPDPPSRLG